MAIFTNQATLSYQNTTALSNVATGEILEVLSVTKTAITESYPATGDVTYAVSILNSGATPIAGVSVEDDLGAYPLGEETLVPLAYRDGSVKLYLNGVLQPQPTVEAANGVTFSGFSIPANSNALLIYETEVTEFAPPQSGGTILNTATVSGTGASAAVTASATVTAAERALLSITKAISPTVVTEGSRITYTFTVQNTGNSEAVATDNVQITDLFDPVLTDLDVSLNGTPLTEGSGYSYNAVTGLFSTVPGVITVPAASYVQDTETGRFVVTPGTAVLTVTGTI